MLKDKHGYLVIGKNGKFFGQITFPGGYRFDSPLEISFSIEGIAYEGRVFFSMYKRRKENNFDFDGTQINADRQLFSVFSKEYKINISEQVSQKDRQYFKTLKRPEREKILVNFRLYPAHESVFADRFQSIAENIMEEDGHRTSHVFGEDDARFIEITHSNGIVYELHSNGEQIKFIDKIQRSRSFTVTSQNIDWEKPLAQIYDLQVHQITFPRIILEAEKYFSLRDNLTTNLKTGTSLQQRLDEGTAKIQ